MCVYDIYFHEAYRGPQRHIVCLCVPLIHSFSHGRCLLRARMPAGPGLLPHSLLVPRLRPPLPPGFSSHTELPRSTLPAHPTLGRRSPRTVLGVVVPTLPLLPSPTHSADLGAAIEFTTPSAVSFEIFYRMHSSESEQIARNCSTVEPLISMRKHPSCEPSIPPYTQNPVGARNATLRRACAGSRPHQALFLACVTLTDHLCACKSGVSENKRVSKCVGHTPATFFCTSGHQFL